MEILKSYLMSLTENEEDASVYQKFFQTKLDAWKINSPLDLKTDEEKAKFFADVKKDWAKYKMSN